ncbi:hypothetical protein [Hymenobacter sp. AT01-02]|uniref:hypothetical protein n=1 Tax=Hymenobacter sp. AT01-02 TaxID=1571877 RepID=UPI0005F0F9A7|nr:hypothetical protein [Hymenobacter sp. AT01-02]
MITTPSSNEFQHTIKELRKADVSAVMSQDAKLNLQSKQNAYKALIALYNAVFQATEHGVCEVTLRDRTGKTVTVPMDRMEGTTIAQEISQQLWSEVGRMQEAVLDGLEQFAEYQIRYDSSEPAEQLWALVTNEYMAVEPVQPLRQVAQERCPFLPEASTIPKLVAGSK